MKLLLKSQEKKLLANGARHYEENHDPKPVVKLFYPGGGATWLLTELDPQNPDIAFGLCDLGHGFPELGSVSLSELMSVRGRFNLSVERDMHFTADKPISEYMLEALRLGRIYA